MVKIFWRWYRMNDEHLEKWRVSQLGAVVDGKLYIRSLIPHPNLWFHWEVRS